MKICFLITLLFEDLSGKTVNIPKACYRTHKKQDNDQKGGAKPSVKNASYKGTCSYRNQYIDTELANHSQRLKNGPIILQMPLPSTCLFLKTDLFIHLLIIPSFTSYV